MVSADEARMHGEPMSDGTANPDHVKRRETDHERARAFAVKWATADSDGEIANLARAYLNAKHEADRPLRELAERAKLVAELERAREDERKRAPNFGLEYVLRDKDGNELQRISPDVPRAIAAFARWTVSGTDAKEG